MQFLDWDAPQLSLSEMSFVELLRKSQNSRIFRVCWQGKDSVLKVVSSSAINHGIYLQGSPDHFSITNQT